MRLHELSGGYPVTPAAADPEITLVTEDSRRVSDHALFVAVTGTALDGHGFIPEAVARGAAAVVVEHAGAVPAGTPVVRVPSSRRALAEIAAVFHGRPADDLSIIGFTGTFGKTSTSEILRALLDAGGGKTGVLGSLGARYRSFGVPPGPLTTPAPVELHRALRGLKDAAAATVILEVTSHALRLGRVHGLTFAGGLLAAILPGEHTDFHRSYEDYVGAKRLFLDHLAPGAVLAYDADNHAARRLASEALMARAAGVSLEGRGADLQVYDVLADHRGTTFNVAGPLAGPESGARVHSSLLGRGHLRNAALALTYAFAAGVDVSAARDVLASLQPLRRRMERYESAGRTILDDTAAHPDSFRATFEVASMLPHDAHVVVYAIRGNRGAGLNRTNALALADLAALHGVTTVILTAASDVTTAKDRATGEEIDAARQALVERGARFVWHDSLRAAIGDASRRTDAGDLVMLMGAQGMDAGRAMLESSGQF